MVNGYDEGIVVERIRKKGERKEEKKRSEERKKKSIHG